MYNFDQFKNTGVTVVQCWIQGLEYDTEPSCVSQIETEIIQQGSQNYDSSMTVVQKNKGAISEIVTKYNCKLQVLT